MRNRLAVALLWGAAGHATLAGLFWWLINVPESNVWMLGLSAALVLLILFLAATVEVTACAWLGPASSFRDALGLGVRGLLAFGLALVAFGACWWLGARLDAWHAARSGEIDAWLIARFDLVEAWWVHRAIAVADFLLRAVFGVALAVAIVFAWVRGGMTRVARLSWLRAALSRQALALTAAALVLFVALPWRAVPWRPEALPPTWVQPALAAARLLAIYLLAHVGWALVLVGGARASAERQSGPAS